MTGLDSRKSTTTAEVVERDITLSQLTDALRASEKRAWGAAFSPEVDESTIVAVAASAAQLAASFPIGTVLELREAGVVAR